MSYFYAIQDIAKMKQEGNETMTYAQYKKIMDNDCKGQLQELSQFAKENRELYRQYSDRYEKEREAKHLIFQLWLNSDEQGRLMVSMPEEYRIGEFIDLQVIRTSRTSYQVTLIGWTPQKAGR